MKEILGTVGGKLPYAELIMKGGDSRPIVLRIHELGGSIDISPGTSHDMVEVTIVLGLMLATVRSIGVVRQLREDDPPAEEDATGGGDDIPF